jgi:hypothetical protein
VLTCAHSMLCSCVFHMRAVQMCAVRLVPLCCLAVDLAGCLLALCK